MSDDVGSKVVWEAESTHPELSQALREGLKEIVDPEIGLNIIELGLIRDVKIEDQEANITMILTTPFCPYGPAMLEVTRQKAAQVLERPAVLTMGTEMWELSMMEEGTGANWGMW
jgi:metal-sulfur cluster biosynthetic enzyme